MKIIGVIPARYASTRFPGKVLAKILGCPMIQLVYERAIQAKYLNDLIVATDDERVKTVVQQFGGKVVMTSASHASGTDRAAEAIANLETDVVVNIQGDEPLISPQAIDAVVKPFFAESEVEMTTLCRQATHREEVLDVNTARVVFDQNHNALYFSRAPIPFDRDHKQDGFNLSRCFQHIGVYGYRKSFLMKLTQIPQTPLEKIEKLEQLRVLESGYSIRVIETEYTPVCVDVPEDIEKVARIMKRNKW